MNCIRRFPRSKLRNTCSLGPSFSNSLQPMYLRLGIRCLRVERQLKAEDMKLDPEAAANAKSHTFGERQDRTANFMGARREAKWKRFFNRHNYSTTDVVIGTFCLSSSVYAFHKMFKLNWAISGVIGFIVFYMVWMP